jgi:hypothetical protein
MKLQLVSICLLFLFSIVIAFPGYGYRVHASQKMSILYASDEDVSFPSLTIILKKCLSKGINMIEEERNTEEDECGSSVVFEYHSYSIQPLVSKVAIRLTQYQSVVYETDSRTIFTPPDCRYSS